MCQGEGCLLTWKGRGSSPYTFALAPRPMLPRCRMPRSSGTRPGSRKYLHTLAWGCYGDGYGVHETRMREVPCGWQQIAEGREQRPAPSCFSVAKEDHKAILYVLSTLGSPFWYLSDVSIGGLIIKEFPYQLYVNLILCFLLYVFVVVVVNFRQ